MRGATQVLVDCPHCRVESALVELLDPSERIGVALEGRCRLCGYATELGEVVRFGHPFVAPDEVVAALGRWAAEDGEADVVVFAVANFNGRDPAGIARAVLAGERVDTGFDVIAWLFPGLQGGRRPDDEERRPRVGPGPAPTIPLPPRPTVPSAATGPTATPSPGGPGGPVAPLAGRYGAEPRPNETERTSVPPPPLRGPGSQADPRDIARALASVMLADGRIRPAEQRFLDAALVRMGAPPLNPADLRVWRPTELGPVPDPAGLLETMRLLALCDHEADGSEQRVLREFARAWQVPLRKTAMPRSGAMAELGRALRRLLVA
ncbi:MAG: hypothetical protein Q8P41_24990 [Pseudomonadota bacterium]|nr:hypothetical protein [Pseudomonadota bacterium]